MKRLSNVDWWKVAHFLLSVAVFVVIFSSFYSVSLNFDGTPGSVSQTYTEYLAYLGFENVAGTDFVDTSSATFGNWFMPISALCKYVIETAGVASTDTIPLYVWKVVLVTCFGLDGVLWVNVLLLVLHVILFIPFATYHFFRRD